MASSPEPHRYDVHELKLALLGRDAADHNSWRGALVPLPPKRAYSRIGGRTFDGRSGNGVRFRIDIGSRRRRILECAHRCALVCGQELFHCVAPNVPSGAVVGEVVAIGSVGRKDMELGVASAVPPRRRKSTRQIGAEVTVVRRIEPESRQVRGRAISVSRLDQARLSAHRTVRIALLRTPAAPAGDVDHGAHIGGISRGERERCPSAGRDANHDCLAGRHERLA